VERVTVARIALDLECRRPQGRRHVAGAALHQ
jgi:hypothetical protein